MQQKAFLARHSAFSAMRRKLNEALTTISCLRALARDFMIQRSEADVPEMLTEPGKWLDGDTLLFKGTPETRHECPSTIDCPINGHRHQFSPALRDYSLEGLEA